MTVLTGAHSDQDKAFVTVEEALDDIVVFGQYEVQHLVDAWGSYCGLFVDPLNNYSPIRPPMARASMLPSTSLRSSLGKEKMRSSSAVITVSTSP